MALVNKNFSDIVTFSRASTATYFNSSGVLSSAASGAPRLDFDPVTLAARGLLIEEQRTNLLLWNRDLTNAAWVKSSITAAKDQAGIDGVANSASTITASGANGTVLQTITSASAARATSAYVKRVTGSGTIEMTQDNGGTWAAITVGASWAKVDLASATVTNPVVGFRIATSGDAIAVDFVGCESASFSTSPRETTTAQATRAADVATINALSPWYSASAGTIYAEFDSLGGSFPAVFSINDGTTSNRINLLASATSTRFAVNSGGVSQADVFLSGYSANTIHKVIGAFAANDFAMADGGTLGSTDSSGTVPTVTKAELGFQSGGLNVLNGHLRKLIFYPSRLANAQLQSLTT